MILLLFPLCRDGEIGRRTGLKIRRAHPPCGFDSRSRHHLKHCRFAPVLRCLLPVPSQIRQSHAEGQDGFFSHRDDEQRHVAERIVEDGCRVYPNRDREVAVEVQTFIVRHLEPRRPPIKQCRARALAANQKRRHDLPFQARRQPPPRLKSTASARPSRLPRLQRPPQPERKGCSA